MQGNKCTYTHGFPTGSLV